VEIPTDETKCPPKNPNPVMADDCDPSIETTIAESNIRFVMCPSKKIYPTRIENSK
jgi:hypothetical protein